MRASPAHDLPRDRDSASHLRGQVLFTVVIVGLVALLGVEAAYYQPSLLVAGPWTSSVEGVSLQVTLNATTISVGQRLNITIVLLNTLTEANLIPTSANWSFHAFPVSIWSSCDYMLPVEFVVLKGNYTLEDLEAVGSNSTEDYMCMEAMEVGHVAFQPTSDIATLNGTYYSATAVPTRVGPLHLATNFTVSGYWDFPVTQAEAQDIYTPYDGGVTFRYPEVSPIPAHDFTPGFYTVAVTDEWGQSTILHFSVRQ